MWEITMGLSIRRVKHALLSAIEYKAGGPHRAVKPSETLLGILLMLLIFGVATILLYLGIVHR